MINLKKNIFLDATYRKLKMKKFCPCNILRKFDNGSAFEVELPEDMDISPTLAIVDIFEYFESNDELKNNLDYPKKKAYIIKKILNSRLSKGTKGNNYMEYLVQGKDKLVEESSWITQAELDFYDLDHNTSHACEH